MSEIREKGGGVRGKSGLALSLSPWHSQVGFPTTVFCRRNGCEALGSTWPHAQQLFPQAPGIQSFRQ